MEKDFVNKGILDIKKNFYTPVFNKNSNTPLKPQNSNQVIYSATPQSNWLQVPIINQRDTTGTQRGLCWAASTACILDYKQGRSLSAQNICDLMRVGYDDGGNIYQAKTAMGYYGVTTARAIESTISDQSVRNYINNNTPIYMSSRTGSGDVGHATVIRGYMCGSNGYMQLSMMNPATERYEAASPGNGYAYTMGNYVFYWKYTVVYN